MGRGTIPLFCIALLSALCYGQLAYGADLLAFHSVIVPYLGAVLLYALGLWWGAARLPLGVIIVAAIGLRLLFLTSTPPLTEDYHRFLWDGQVSAQGINPFSATPQELHDQGSVTADPRCLELMNSRTVMTVYPPLLQGVYASGALLFPQAEWGQLMVQRLWILAAELATLLLLASWCRRRGVRDTDATGVGHASLPSWGSALPGLPLALYAFNPLIIVEFSGNLHAEGIMMAGLMLLLWAEQRGKRVLASLGLGLAVAAKLLPLIVLPLLLRRWGLMRGGLAAAAIMLANALLWLPFYYPGMLERLSSSYGLYFSSHFEFHASIYFLIRFLSDVAGFGEGAYPLINRGLSLAVTLAILAYSFGHAHAGRGSLAMGLLVIWSLFYFAASVVHPWYIGTLVLCAAMTGVRFPLLWAALVPLTYATYAQIPFHEYRGMSAAIYVVVAGVLLWDLGWGQRLWASAKLMVARRKLCHLLPYYPPRAHIVEVGAGNGALSAVLLEHDFQVSAVDIIDKNRYHQVSVTTFDGEHLPFTDDSADVVQLITVLHHAPTTVHAPLLREAARVGRHILIMEDIASNPLQHRLMCLADSLFNNEWRGHPHSNRSDEQWRHLFADLGLDVVQVRYSRALLIFRQAVYVLQAQTRQQAPEIACNQSPDSAFY